jgi:hypothetical protein
MTKRDLTVHMVKLASFSFQANHFRMMRIRQVLIQRKYKYYNENNVNASLCNLMEL